MMQEMQKLFFGDPLGGSPGNEPKEEEKPVQKKGISL